MKKNHDFKMKVAKTFPSFVDTLEGLTGQDLEKNLLIYSKHREDTLLSQKFDKALNKAKETVTELNAPYSDTIKALKMKMAYINILLRELSGELDEE